MTNEEYKALRKIIKEKEAKFNATYNQDGTHAQRVADYYQGMDEILDIIFFGEHKKESK